MREIWAFKKGGVVLYGGRRQPDEGRARPKEGTDKISFATYAVSGLAEFAAVHNNLFVVMSALPPTADLPVTSAGLPLLLRVVGHLPWR